MGLVAKVKEQVGVGGLQPVVGDKIFWAIVGCLLRCCRFMILSPYPIFRVKKSEKKNVEREIKIMLWFYLEYYSF